MARHQALHGFDHVVILLQGVRSERRPGPLGFQIPCALLGWALSLVLDDLLPDALDEARSIDGVDSLRRIEEIGKGEGVGWSVLVADQSLVGDDEALEDGAVGRAASLGGAVVVGPVRGVLDPPVHLLLEVSVAPLIPYADGGAGRVTCQSLFHLVQEVVVPRDGVHRMTQDNHDARKCLLEDAILRHVGKLLIALGVGEVGLDCDGLVPLDSIEQPVIAGLHSGQARNQIPRHLCSRPGIASRKDRSNVQRRRKTLKDAAVTGRLGSVLLAGLGLQRNATRG
mmetsp:Transcript_5674/g.13613  ORF Transcript_5674/g.13613 Transcript_5674/m.13613 type:complete len:283 (+) Transcript_5674:262-1110(+)